MGEAIKLGGGGKPSGKNAWSAHKLKGKLIEETITQKSLSFETSFSSTKDLYYSDEFIIDPLSDVITLKNPTLVTISSYFVSNWNVVIGHYFIIGASATNPNQPLYYAPSDATFTSKDSYIYFNNGKQFTFTPHITEPKFYACSDKLSDYPTNAEGSDGFYYDLIADSPIFLYGQGSDGLPRGLTINTGNDSKFAEELIGHFVGSSPQVSSIFNKIRSLVIKGNIINTPILTTGKYKVKVFTSSIAQKGYIRCTVAHSGIWLSKDVTTIQMTSDGYIGMVNGIYTDYSQQVQTIYCEVASKPSGWADKWNYGRGNNAAFQHTVVWGVTEEAFDNI